MLVELQSRGLKGILFACIDGLKGFPDIINHLFEHSNLALHSRMVRNSMKFVPYKNYKLVAADLKRITSQ
ncbi:transposase [Shewanella sp. YLB-07]|uniref:transposase n=1 Tax=Shewanella sp. YLB-07 TaxID=2601268 RepID=UPI00128BA178|nr:hypothetical protein [Shewanella sp. YLB-07]